MIRIKQIIKDRQNNKEIRFYLKDSQGIIKIFNNVKEAQEFIEFIEYCTITKNNQVQYKIVGKE
jgi:hypothetical protein